MRRVVPWSSKDEWNQVYEYLYSSDPTLQRIGVNRVKAWSSRGRLPHAIESTSTLLEAQLQDSLSIESPLSDRELSNLYAIYLIRFVNGFVDSAQKGTFASSATAVAEQLGLPVWFVEIRHQATHEKMPNLPYLRKCSVQAISWLRDRYWQIQANALEDAYQHTLSLVHDYFSLSVQDQASRGGKVVNNITSTLSKDSYPDILLPILINRMEKGFDINGWSFLVSQCVSAWSDFSETLLLALVDEVFNKDSQSLFKWVEYYIQQSATELERASIEELITRSLQAENQLGYDIVMVIQKTTGLPESNTHLLFLLECLGKKLSLSRAEKESKDISSPINIDDLENGIEQLKKNIQNMDKESIMAFPTPEEDGKDSVITGWYLETDWQPCPIGCLPGSSTIPNLELDLSFDSFDELNKRGILQIPMPRQVVSSIPASNEKEEVIKLF